MSELWDCYDSNFNILKGKVLVRVVYFATVSCEKNSVILQAGETIAYQWVTKSDIFSKRAQIANRRIFEMLPELDAVESH